MDERSPSGRLESIRTSQNNNTAIILEEAEEWPVGTNDISFHLDESPEDKHNKSVLYDEQDSFSMLRDDNKNNLSTAQSGGHKR